MTTLGTAFQKSCSLLSSLHHFVLTWVTVFREILDIVDYERLAEPSVDVVGCGIETRRMPGAMCMWCSWTAWRKPTSSTAPDSCRAFFGGRHARQRA